MAPPGCPLVAVCLSTVPDGSGRLVAGQGGLDLMWTWSAWVPVLAPGPGYYSETGLMTPSLVMGAAYRMRRGQYHATARVTLNLKTHTDHITTMSQQFHT